MELFGGLIPWTDLPSYIVNIVSYLNPLSVNTVEEYVALMLRLQIITLAVALGLYLVEHLMGGYALYVMAKRAGVKHAWLGFLPFGSTWLAGRLAGETRVFNAKMKRAGLYAMLLEIVFVLSCVFVLVLSFMLCRPEFYVEKLNEAGEVVGYVFESTNLPVGMRWMYQAVQILDIVNSIFDLVVIFFFCLLFFAFFRKYFARSPFLMTFLCALLPVRGFVLFAVRNNAAIDYDAYIRRRAEEYNRARYGYTQAQQYDPTDNFDPKTGEPIHHGPPEDPFSDFSDGNSGDAPPGGANDESPFSDF